MKEYFARFYVRISGGEPLASGIVEFNAKNLTHAKRKLIIGFDDLKKKVEQVYTDPFRDIMIDNSPYETLEEVNRSGLPYLGVFDLTKSQA